MKILYYSPHPDLSLDSPSGYGTHMREMIRAFEALGHWVKPVIMGDILRRGTSVSSMDGSRLLKPLMPAWMWETMKDVSLLSIDRQLQRHLAGILYKEKPDLIYERAAYLQTSGVRTARRFGIPHCLEMNAPYIKENRILRGARSLMEYRAHRAEREQLTLTHCTAVVSAGLIDYFISEHPVAPESLLCTPNGIDPDQVVSNEARVDELRHRYGLHGNVVIGFVGSIIRWQRLDLLIDAFSKIVGRYNDARLLIVGDSPLVETLKQQTLRLHLDERVVFAGRIHHSEVYNHIALMDIAVLPDNLWYGSPTKLFEYGAMGKAIVAPKNASLSAILTDQVEGLLVEPHVESLRRAIESLILDPHRRSRLGNAFRTRVHSSFTWRHNAERIIDAVFKPEPVA